jgi:hypothetical protein
VSTMASNLFGRCFYSRGGGIRTHTPFQDPDFKSENRSPGASYPSQFRRLDKPKTRLSPGRASGCIRVHPTLYCCRTAAIASAFCFWRSTRLRLRLPHFGWYLWRGSVGMSISPHSSQSLTITLREISQAS